MDRTPRGPAVDWQPIPLDGSVPPSGTGHRPPTTYKGLCHYCGVKGTTRDHIVPRSLLRSLPEKIGRNQHLSNIVPACGNCNRKKGNKRSDCPCPTCLAAWDRFGPPGWQDIEIIRLKRAA